MESESSGMPDDTSFTQNAERWDDVTSHEEMTCDHNVHHADMDSCSDKFKTSQGSVCETSDNQDVMFSVKEEQESSNAFESRVVDVSDEDTEEGMCFSPSFICKDLSVFNHKNSSPVSNGEHLCLNSTKEAFRYHNRDVLPDLSDEDIPSAVNQEEWCYHDLYQDVCLAFQQLEEQVALYLSRVDESQLLHFLSTLITSFFEFCCHKVVVAISLFFAFSTFTPVHVALSFVSQLISDWYFLHASDDLKCLCEYVYTH